MDRECTVPTEVFERCQLSENALVAGMMELAAVGRPTALHPSSSAHPASRLINTRRRGVASAA